MALNLKLKLKSNLKQQIENENKREKKQDKRFLNYYDLKEGEKIKLLIVPDTNGNLWTKFRKHGPNLKVPGVGSVRCLHEAAGENCPACEKGFEFLNLHRESGLKEHKDEAKRWFARDYLLMSCIVLESPIEIAESPDKNQVKLLFVPYAVENIIKEAITEGVLEEDEICSTPFFLKKTLNGGGYADYTNSYFARKQIDDDELEFFSDLVVEQYDYDTIDVIPEAPSHEEVEEWLAKAIELDAKAKKGDTEKEEEQPARKLTTPVKKQQADEKEEAARPAKKVHHHADDIDEDESSMGEEPAVQEKEEEQPAPSKSSSLRDRLKNLR